MGRKPKKPKLTAWSPSRLKNYENCPRKAKYLYVDKLKEPGSVHTEYGHEVHGSAERYVLGQTDELHDGVGAFRDDVLALREQRASTGRSATRWMSAEMKLALSEDLDVVDWFSPQAWARMVFDVVKYNRDHVEIIDYKTGKIREEDYDQMDIYAWAAFHAYDASTVETKLWYLKFGVENSSHYRREELPKLGENLHERLKPYLTDTEFAPRPSPLCGWCHFSAKSGGDPRCEAAVR